MCRSRYRELDRRGARCHDQGSTDRVRKCSCSFASYGHLSNKLVCGEREPGVKHGGTEGTENRGFTAEMRRTRRGGGEGDWAQRSRRREGRKGRNENLYMLRGPLRSLRALREC